MPARHRANRAKPFCLLLGAFGATFHLLALCLMLCIMNRESDDNSAVSWTEEASSVLYRRE